MSFISEKSKKIPGSMIREMFAMRLLKKRLIICVRRHAIEMEPQNVPVPSGRIGKIMLRIAAVDPEKASGGKSVGFAAIFQYSLTGQRQLDKV